jgi:hypothetical protein
MSRLPQDKKAKAMYNWKKSTTLLVNGLSSKSYPEANALRFPCLELLGIFDVH